MLVILARLLSVDLVKLGADNDYKLDAVLLYSPAGRLNFSQVSWPLSRVSREVCRLALLIWFPSWMQILVAVLSVGPWS